LKASSSTTMIFLTVGTFSSVVTLICCELFMEESGLSGMELTSWNFL
jgi:hypothetical protein